MVKIVLAQTRGLCNNTLSVKKKTANKGGRPAVARHCPMCGKRCASAREAREHCKEVNR